MDSSITSNDLDQIFQQAVAACSSGNVKQGVSIYAQLIDDRLGVTIAASSSVQKTIKKDMSSTATKEASKMVGIAIGKLGLEKQIGKIVFDRGNRPYQGRIESVADGAREAGLIF